MYKTYQNLQSFETIKIMLLIQENKTTFIKKKVLLVMHNTATSFFMHQSENMFSGIKVKNVHNVDPFIREKKLRLQRFYLCNSKLFFNLQFH